MITKGLCFWRGLRHELGSTGLGSTGLLPLRVFGELLGAQFRGRDLQVFNYYLFFSFFADGCEFK